MSDVAAARRIAAAAALAAALVSLPALRNGFAIDDRYLVVENRQIESLGNLPSFFGGAVAARAAPSTRASMPRTTGR